MLTFETERALVARASELLGADPGQESGTASEPRADGSAKAETAP